MADSTPPDLAPSHVSLELDKAFQDNDVEKFDWICVDNSLIGSSVVPPNTEPLIFRCMEHGDVKFLEHLLNGGSFAHPALLTTGKLPVHAALALGRFDLVQVLLCHAPWTAFSTCGSKRSCLHYASAQGDARAIHYLCRSAFKDPDGLERRLNVEVRDGSNCTPLHIAARCGQLSSVESLLRYSSEGESGELVQVNVNAAESSGRTPLHLACIGGHVDVVNALVGVTRTVDEWAWRKTCPKADVNHFDLFGRTALHYTAMCGDDRCAEVLLRHGADVTALAEPSHTVYSALAAAVEDSDVAACFSEYGLEKADLEDTRSMLSSLELANVSSLHRQSDSHSPTLSMRSNHFGDEEALESSDIGDFSTSDASSVESPPPRLRCIVNNDAAALSGGNDPLSLSTFLHGVSRQYSLSPRSAQQAIVMAASRLKPDAISKGVQFPKVTALTEACAGGQTEVVKLLLRYGANDETRLGVKLALFADLGHVVQALLAKCHKFEVRNKRQHDQEDQEDHCHTLAERPASAASISWSNLLLWKLDDQWLQCVEQLDRDTHPIATSYRLQPQHTPCVTLYHYPALLQSTVHTPSAIVHLELHSNMLTTIPITVFRLEHLEALNLSDNQLTSLPTAAAESNSAGGELMDAPQEDELQGWRCKKLAKLKLDGNKMLEELPPCVWFLPLLRVLELKHGGLKSLPKFTELHATRSGVVAPCLKILDLCDNMIGRVDGGLFYIPELEQLNLSNNHLSALPPQMWMAFNLTKLDLSRNRLARLPSLVKPFRDLLSPLHSDVPPAYQDFYKQRVTECVDRETTAQFRSLPSSLVRIDPSNTMLKPECLTVHGYEGSAEMSNSISQPAEHLRPVYQTTASPVWPREESLTSQSSHESENGSSPMILVELNLSRNHLVSVPEMLACLAPRLTSLNMSHNYLTSLGPVGNIPSCVSYLNMSNCRIRSCHTAHGAAGMQRQQCHLVVSAISSDDDDGDSPLCSHRQHSILPSLERLLLDHNKLERLTLARVVSPGRRPAGPDASDPGKGPMEIVTKPLYPVLRDLSITHNRLSQISPLIGGQKNLKSMNVSHNKSLTRIPPELGKLKGSLLSLEVTGVELIFPSPATHSPRHLPAFLSFLKSTLMGSQEFRHMRLTVVGRTRRGKTTLLERLRGVPPMQLGPPEPTISIDMLDVELQPPKQPHGSHEQKKPIIFNCWDFAGEELYYSLHQCFIFQRTLFLVVWKLTDGEQGVDELEQWLVNIQSRAPDSPVLIVGTHLDCLPSASRKTRVEELQHLVATKYRCTPPKTYLPKILGTAAVSSTARRHHCIDDLKVLMYKIASNLELKQRGAVEYTEWPEQSANLLLSQPVPASYLQLRERILEAASDRYRAEKSVLTKEKFRHEFRDCANDEEEFEQAISFCHYQGLILHYQEAALQRLFFLDPSWLCKIMAKIINPDGGPRCRGLLALADLQEVLQHSESLVSYILHLLEKFEVVLRLSDDLCLVQSQLDAFSEGTFYDRLNGTMSSSQISVRPRAITRAAAPQTLSSYLSLFSASTPSLMSAGATPQAVRDWRKAPGAASVHFDDSFNSDCAESYMQASAAHGERVAADFHGADSYSQMGARTPAATYELGSAADRCQPSSFNVTNTPDPVHPAPRVSSVNRLSRLWILECFPSGFWSRLLSRVLHGSMSDDIIGYHLPLCNLSQFRLEALVDARGNATGVHHGPLCWYCWSDRLELRWQECTLMRLTLTSSSSSSSTMNGRAEEVAGGGAVRYVECTTDGQYCCTLGTSRSVLELEVFVDIWSSFANAYSSDGSGWQRAFTRPAWCAEDFQEVGFRIASSWLSRMTQTVCVLVGDWFHGVVREGQLHCALPCHMCMDGEPSHPETVALFRAAHAPHQRAGNACYRDGVSAGIPASRELDQDVTTTAASTPAQGESRGQGLRAQSADESSTDYPIYLQANTVVCFKLSSLVFLLQQCEQSSTTGADRLGAGIDDANRRGLVQCPKHGFFFAADCAPDLAFEDVSRNQLLSLTSTRNVQTDKMLLGFGGQGVIFRGRLRQDDQSLRVVALKFFHWDEKEMRKKTRLGPIDLRRLVAEKQEDSWTSYESLRQEVNMLLCLSHPHIMAMVGVSSSPHCVVLDLAPLGNLRVVYSAFRKTGIRLGNFSTRQLAYQVASALAYIHERSIVYRDMKSDNVLAFSFPSPSHHHDLYYNLVHVKLTDHGISHMSGQAMRVDGTARFIAPEVLTHHGSEPYGPKVDVFSYGMFLYELISMEKPFASYHDARANDAVVREERPKWTPELGNASVCAQDVMMKCWLQDPDQRPTMAEVLTMIKMPTFARILNALFFEECFTILDACVSVATSDVGKGDTLQEKQSGKNVTSEIWVCGGSRDCGVAAVLNMDTYKIWNYKVCDNRITCVGSVGNTVWIGTSAGYLCIYDVQSRHRMFYGVIAVGRYALQITHCKAGHCVLVAVSDKTLRAYNDELQFSPGQGEGVLETLSVAFMPSRWSICCVALAPHPSARSLLEAQNSGRVDVWCGLDSGHIMVYDMDHRTWAQNRAAEGRRGSTSACPPSPTSPTSNSTDVSVEEDDPSLLQEKESLQLPFHDNQPCSFVCVTQFEDDEASGDGSAPALRTRVWLAVRRRSVVSCWTYGSVCWSPFDMSLYLRSAEAFQARVTCMTSWKHEVYVGTGSGHVVILDSRRMQCTSFMSIHGGPVRRLLSLPPSPSSLHANCLYPRSETSTDSGNDGSRGVGNGEQLEMRSRFDPARLSGPAMTGQTAVDVYLHANQANSAVGSPPTMEITRQVSQAFSRQTSLNVDPEEFGTRDMTQSPRPPTSLSSSAATAATAAVGGGGGGGGGEDPPQQMAVQPCIDATNLHLMFSCGEKQIPMPGPAEGARALRRAPVFMMTWLAGEWHDHV